MQHRGYATPASALAAQGLAGATLCGRALHGDRGAVHMEEARAVQLRERIAPGGHGMRRR